MGRPTKILSKEDLLRAMRMTQSNRAAARYLQVSYVHYKKYAKLYTDTETGKSLLEVHKNQSGRGIPKYLSNSGKEPALIDLIEGRSPIENFTPQKIKERLIFESLIEEVCSVCGFRERRIVDLRVPLILSHKDGNLKNYRLDNLQFLCYNCSFLYAVSPITDKQVSKMEDYVDKQGEEVTWELDEYQIEHLKELNLYDEPDSDKQIGSEYISRPVGNVKKENINKEEI